ncbi:MAG: ABC transporter substrate-binding protein [Thermodesulfobacteriota bacterium]|nr:ABC transporter substrate-binding protein [Thermodesulfobacteriota bacterium]
MIVSLKNVKKTILFGFLSLSLLSMSAHAAQQSGKKIKLGIPGPLAFVAGESIVQGATIAIEEINNSGGVKVGKIKYKFEMIKADDNCLRSVSDAVSAIERLITVDKVDFIVGGYHSESVLAQMDVIADYKIIFIDVGSASLKPPSRVAKDYNRFKYYFRIQINSIHMAKGILGSASIVADKIRKELGVKVPKVALLVEKMVFADPVAKFLAAKLPKMGMEVVGVWRPSSMATDLMAEWTAIKSSNAHMVLEVFSGPAGTIGPRQWGELQIPVALLGTNIQAMQEGHWKSTNGKCQYELTFSGLGPAEVTPRTMPFYHTFDNKYGGYPLHIAADTYDAIFALKDAIEKAGTIETEAVVKALEKTDLVGALGRIIFESPKHKYPHMVRMGPGYYTTVAFQWIEGKQVVVWPDGRALLGDQSWVGVRHGGTEDYVLPTWMVEYWKGKTI